MKNLKKFLIALVVLAVLISSVVVLVVTADDEIQYTGDLGRAQELLAEVPAMDRTDVTTKMRGDAIKKVYNYIGAYPIDPETEGYEEFTVTLYDLSSKIFNKFYDRLVAASSKADKERELTSVYAYIEICYIPEDAPDPDGDGEEYRSYAELRASAEAYNFNMMKGYYDSAAGSLSSGNLDDARSKLVSVYTHVSKWPLLEPEKLDFAEFYESYNTLSLEISESIVAEIQSFKEAGDEDGYKASMQANLPIMRDHMEKCPVDLEAFTDLVERYEALTPALNVFELDQIIYLFDDYGEFKPDETMLYPELARAAALAKVSKALSDSSVPEDTPGYAELVADIEEAKAEIESIKEARRLKLDSQSKLYEYDLIEKMSYTTFSSDTETMVNPNADAGEYSERIKTYDNGMSSGYEAYWRYTYSTGREGNTNYASITEPYIANGFVHSFDMMVEGRNGQHFKGATFSNEWTNANSTRLVNYEGNEFSMGYDAATDSIWFKQGNGISNPVTVKHLAAEGQWFNVMITYDPTNQTGKLYIDYQYVFDIYYNGYPGEDATRMIIRISHSADWQYVCYDNIRFYQGTVYRDVDKFTDMTEKEKFEFYVGYFLNGKNDSKSRNTAYMSANLLLDQMKVAVEGEELSDEEKEALQTLIDAFEGYNYEGDIANKVKDENLDKIIDMANTIGRVEKHDNKIGNGYCDLCGVEMPCEHVDETGDGYCDLCEAEMPCEHIDETVDGVCDLCEEEMPCEHVDKGCYCDLCEEKMSCVDADGDDYCDICEGCVEHVDTDKNDKCDRCKQEMPCEHVYKDGYCDNCEEEMPCEHVDEVVDGVCDLCGEEMPCEHVDAAEDGYCDLCEGCVEHTDADKNDKCDLCEEEMPCEHVDETGNDACVLCGKEKKERPVPNPNKYFIKLNSDDINKINKDIANFEAFIAENNDFVDKSHEYYVLSIQMINDVKAAIVKLENAKLFARALVQFERATTVASMTKRAAAASEIFKLARYDKLENVEFVKDDSVFKAFELIINGKDADPSDEENYITAFEYYYMMPEIIAEQTKYENSIRVIKCIELLLQIEGYEDTEEFWLANYDEVDFYMTIIRDIVSVDNYDPTYPGIDEALGHYDVIDAFFFVLLQEEHKEIIGTQLDKFAASSSYIEKIGICTYLDRYFETNSDIDLTLPEIQEFIYRLEMYKAELEIYREDYLELLERNTQYFIDTVNRMSAFTDYADLKPLYDEALSYYYAMNADTEAAKAAVALFDEYDKALLSIETNSELFLASSYDLDLLEYVGVDSEFTILSKCSFYYDYIDVTYSQALATRAALYEELAASYNLVADGANASIDTSIEIVSAVRSNQIPVSILAVTNQLYKN